MPEIVEKTEIAGRAAIFPAGDFVFGTAYKRLDMVRYDGVLYVAKKDNTDVYPTNKEFWMLSVKAAEVDSETIGEIRQSISANAELIEQSQNLIAQNNQLIAQLSSQSEALSSAIENLQNSAFSGNYNDLTNKPNINNGTLTIQKNGTNVQTFSANQGTNTTANITVPTKVSELANDSNFVSTDKITQSNAITQAGYVVDGRELNPTLPNTLASKIYNIGTILRSSGNEVLTQSSNDFVALNSMSLSAGIWIVKGDVEFRATNGAGNRTVALYEDGTLKASTEIQGSANGWTIFSALDIISISTAKTVSVRSRQTSGSAFGCAGHISALRIK